MRQWDLTSIATPGGSVSPVVLDSQDERRAVLVGLEPGQELGEHQVKEHALVLVLDGEARFESDGDRVDAGAGTLVAFAPDERRAVSTAAGARLLMLLTPWPGPGHYRGSEQAAS